MATAPRIAGICFIKLDGDQLEVSGGVEVPINDTVRETKAGPNGPAGFSEVAVIPSVKVSAFLTPDFPREKVAQSTDMTITAELANGKTYVLSGAFLVGDASAKQDDGTVDLEFNGLKGMWQE